MTNTTTLAIASFYSTVDGGSDGFDVRVNLNGAPYFIGFAAKVQFGHKRGYTFVPLTLSQFPEHLHHAAESLAWHQAAAEECGPLSTAEVHKRAGILAGIWLAGKSA